MEMQSEGRKINYHVNPANGMHVITVNDSQIELSKDELTEIASAALTKSETKQAETHKKGK